MKITLFLTTLVSMTIATTGFAQNKKAAPKTKPAVQQSSPTTTVPEATPKNTEPTALSAEPPSPVAPAETATPPVLPLVEAPIGQDPSRPTSNEHGHLFGLNAAVGFPYFYSGGLNYVMPSHMFSFELNVGSGSVTASDVTVKLANTEVGARWHPFEGAFYVGVLAGNRTLSAEKPETVQGQSIMVKGELKSSYVTPHIGWMWGSTNGGFFAGMDLGYLSPSGASATVTTTAPTALQTDPQYTKTEKDVRDQIKSYGEIGLPFFTLIKIGWLF